MSLITLITDFGTTDWFVGTMKGVILCGNPRASIVDITHEVSPGKIEEGAITLAACYHYFPAKSVHLVVVDPGVGSLRKAMAVRTDKYFFVAPDNGVLSLALARENIKEIRLLENEKYFLKTVSQTFHGRDVFAPVAAHLSRGLSLKKLGPEQATYKKVERPKPIRWGSSFSGQIIYIDRFGNALTNIHNDQLSPEQGYGMVFKGQKPLAPMAANYQAVPAGNPVAVPGSSGFIEIAINGGQASKKLGLKTGTNITVRPGNAGLKKNWNVDRRTGAKE